MPPGQSGVLRLFGVGCGITFLQVLIEGGAINLAATESFVLDMPLPDIDIYSNLSGFAANTPMAHLEVNMADKKNEQLIHGGLSVQPDHVYEFTITIDANNIPILRLTVTAGAGAGLVFNFDHTWDIWITNCNPFYYNAEAPQ